LTKFGQVEPHLSLFSNLLAETNATVLQRTVQIVDATPLGLLFLQCKKMNREATEMELLNAINGTNGFRACIGCLIDPLLRQRESMGL
jgi:hypothetical protein